jgi:hypothetical protein
MNFEQLVPHHPFLYCSLSVLATRNKGLKEGQEAKKIKMGKKSPTRDYVWERKGRGGDGRGGGGGGGGGRCGGVLNKQRTTTSQRFFFLELGKVLGSLDDLLLDLEDVEADGLGEGAALTNSDRVTLLDTNEARGHVGSQVLFGRTKKKGLVDD